jgi:hypothetical protein
MEHGADQRRVSVVVTVGREVLADGPLADSDPVSCALDGAGIDVGAEGCFLALATVVDLTRAHAASLISRAWWRLQNWQMP